VYGWIHKETRCLGALMLKNLMDRMSIYESLKRNKIEPFQKRLITGEKWISMFEKDRSRSEVRYHKQSQTRIDAKEAARDTVCLMKLEENRPL